MKVDEKNIYVCGKPYKIKFLPAKNKKVKGGRFECKKRLVEVCNDKDWLSYLIHELSELIMVERYHRYYNNSGSSDYEFHFNHKEFSLVCEEIAGALEQLLETGDKYGLVRRVGKPSSKL